LKQNLALLSILLVGFFSLDCAGTQQDITTKTQNVDFLIDQGKLYWEQRTDSLALKNAEHFIRRSKEKKVLNEDEKLCQVFQQGPLLCKKFDKTLNVSKDDALSVEILNSFEKREKVFCSTKPLHKKDLEVYQEQKRLCKTFNDKIITYQKNVDNNEMSLTAFSSYKKRAEYFCAIKNPKK